MRPLLYFIFFLSASAFAETCNVKSNSKIHCDIVPGEMYMFKEGFANHDHVIKCKKLNSLCTIIFENNSYSIYDSFGNKIRESTNESEALSYLKKVNIAKAC